MRNLQNKLDREPALIRKGFPSDWPYVIHHYEKTGVIEARIQVASTTDAVAADTVAVRKTFNKQDTTIGNANPGIGLNVDPLTLPSSEEVRKILIRSAGSEAALKIVSSVLKARVEEVRAQVKKALREGKSAEVLEANMDLVHLMKPYNALEAGKLLASLRLRRK